MSQFFVETTGGNLPPTVATSYVTNAGTAVPAANILNVLGTTVSAGTHPFISIGSGNTVTYEVQFAQAIASTNATNVGVSAFNSADFTVDANGFVSIKAFTPFVYTQINHASSPYTVLANDDYISADPTAGTISIVLPNSTTLYRMFTIKDRTGMASINNITITTGGGIVTIDGQTTYTISGNFGAIQLLWNGVSYEIF